MHVARLARGLACATVLSLFSGLAGCTSCAGTGQRALGMIEGPINDPANRSLRRSILAFGLSEFCHQMTTHDAPLKLTDDSPIIGRFYPTTCSQRELENGDLLVNFGGYGYAWTNVSKKMTFSSTGQVHYNQDFLMDGSTMYAYFRTKELKSSDFQTHVIEQPIANFVNQITPLGNNFGRQLLSGKLAEGFTVIREANGTADFAIGIVEKGKRPVHPFDVHGDDRVTYENLRTEVHQNQRDFIGPIEVEDGGRALYLTANVDGGQPIDVLVMTKDAAEQSLKLYYDYPMSGPLAMQPMLSDVAQPGVEYRRMLAVPKGIYYVVLDNTPTAGTVAPPNNPLDDRAAVVNYVVQIGDAP
jgi:hypothetical protein